MDSNKVYLGDGVYISFDGYGFMLTVEDGMSVTGRVYLEPEVWRALQLYFASWQKEQS